MIVWIVNARTGEWSERREWPIEGYTSQQFAQDRVNELDLLKQQCPYPYPEDPENWENQVEVDIYNEAHARRDQWLLDNLFSYDIDVSYFITNVEIVK